MQDANSSCIMSFVVNKSLLRPIGIFLLITLVGLSFGCDDSSDNANLTKSSDYPPLVSGIADAPIEMVDGSPSKIADRKGKVVLVNLWATWCGYCRQEMPHLISMQNQYRDKGFQVLG